MPGFIEPFLLSDEKKEQLAKRRVECVQHSKVFQERVQTKIKTKLQIEGAKITVEQEMDQDAQRYIDESMVIFSNIFGPVCAKDRLPDYKLKQGERIGDFAPEKFYKTHFTKALDDYLAARGPIVDLRAGFYEKFYRVAAPHITMKFLKNGKTVSHWAKAYRGIVAKAMAENNIMDEETLMNMDIEGLGIVEMKKMKNRKEIVYEIES